MYIAPVLKGRKYEELNFVSGHHSGNYLREYYWGACPFLYSQLKKDLLSRVYIDKAVLLFGMAANLNLKTTNHEHKILNSIVNYSCFTSIL